MKCRVVYAGNDKDALGMPLELRMMNGNDDIKLFGLTNAERVRRMRAKGLEAERKAVRKGKGGNASERAERAERVIDVNLDYAFDPAWFAHIAQAPGRVLRDGDTVVLAHRDARGETGARQDGEELDLRSRPALYNHKLRKTQRPFCLPLSAENRRRIERESYDGAYKGVTDLLTKYLWPGFAFHLTRLAARVGLTPNMVTAIGAALCVAAAWLFAEGDYWAGVAAGFAFMVLDTVDGKLARCTMTSSRWGHNFDHGIDLIHPPFWYWFWATGLVHWGLGLDGATFWIVQGVIWAGYILQRVVEGIFLRRYGFHIHVWRRFDSDFRLVTARRNPNMVLLVGALLFGRPDIGIILVAIWTALSLVVHVAQLVQARAAERGGSLTSWLEKEAA